MALDGASTLGKTGGGTLGKTGGGTIAAGPNSPTLALSLAVAPDSLAAPGTVIVTVEIPADADATTESTHDYPVPLSSSDAACHVPAAVTVAWTSTTGGAARFMVQCSAVSSDRTVTITAGNASVGFDLTQ